MTKRLLDANTANSWYEDGHHFVRWRPVSQGLLRAAKLNLGKQLKPYLITYKEQSKSQKNTILIIPTSK